MRGTGLRCCLAAVAALLLVGCRDDPAGPEPVATLQAVPPATFTVYAAAPTAVFVRALDENGDPVRGATITWRVLEGNGTLSRDTSSTDELGVAGITWTTGAQVGQAERLEASHAGAQPVVFTATPARPENVVITTTGSGQTAQPLTPLVQPLVVRVTLPDGRPLPGVPVTWVAPPGSYAAVVPVETTPTNAQGEARGTWTVSAPSGTYTVIAIVGTGESRVVVPFTVTVVPGPVTQIESIIYDTPCQAAGTVVEPLWGVRLRDAYNNPVPGVQVNFAAGPGSSVNPATATTGADGRALTQWTVQTTPGTDTMSATIPSLGHTRLFAKDVCPGPVARSELAVPGAVRDTLRLAVGQEQGIQVLQYDAHGNRVPVNRRASFGWESADSTVARVIPPLEGDAATVRAESPGTTVVRVRQSRFPADSPVLDSVVVIVAPAPAVRAQARPTASVGAAGNPFAVFRGARPATVVRGR